MPLHHSGVTYRSLVAVAAFAVAATAATGAPFAAPGFAAPGTGPVPSATGENIVEDFATVPPSGWTNRDNSAPTGLMASWFKPTGTPTMTAHQGGSSDYAAANHQATTSGGTLSAWLITPLITDLTTGDAWSFHTSQVADGDGQWPDRLEVRLSTNGSCDPGMSSDSVGDFETVLTTVNPDLQPTVYPRTWTEYSGSLPTMTRASGCLAFRYFVTNGGPDGANAVNSNYIGIDTFRYTHVPDPVIPDTTLDAVTPTGPGTVTATFSGTPDHAIATYECSLNEAAYTTCTSPLTLTGLAEGSHTLSVRATTTAGNLDPSPAVETFTIDAAAPPATEPTTGPAKLTKVKITAPKKARSAKKVKITLTGLTPGAKVTIKLGKKKKTFTVTKTAKGTTKVTVKLKAPKTRKNRTYRITATATLGAQKATTKKKLKVRARR